VCTAYINKCISTEIEAKLLMDEALFFFGGGEGERTGCPNFRTCSVRILGS